MENYLSLKNIGASLFNDDLKDVTIDIAEISIDSFLDNNSVFSQLPFVKTAIGTYKTMINIKDRFDLKKLCVFLKQFQSGQVDEAEIEKRRIAYENDEKWFYKEVETIMVFLSRYEDAVKAKLEAEIYIDFINRVISEQKFKEYLAILDRLFVNDVEYLEKIYIKQKVLGLTEKNPAPDDKSNEIEFDKAVCERLVSVGVLMHVYNMIYGPHTRVDYLYTKQGEYICNIFNRIKCKD